MVRLCWTILADSFSDLILFVDDNAISPGESVTIRNVNCKLTNLAVISDLLSGVANNTQGSTKYTHKVMSRIPSG